MQCAAGKMASMEKLKKLTGGLFILRNLKKKVVVSIFTKPEMQCYANGMVFLQALGLIGHTGAST